MNLQFCIVADNDPLLMIRSSVLMVAAVAATRSLALHMVCKSANLCHNADTNPHSQGKYIIRDCQYSL